MSNSRFIPHVLATCFLMLACCGTNEHPATAPSVPETEPEPVAALPATPTGKTSLDLSFTVDPTLSIGTIDTTLDPEGVILGPRKGVCKTPLKGSIKAALLTKPDGSRHLQITRVSLSTTKASELVYEWSALLGEIRCTIPTGQLKITDHQLAGPSPLDGRNSFAKEGNLFSVTCPAHILGSGLVLKEAVGERKENLDIPVTEPVSVAGSCNHQDGQLVLHIPRAVLRDHFDLGKATLDLVFTGDITATCPEP